ncbi:EscU/YscU/HrcU family type III secretion system export apparatus switch protein [Pseudoalteromonas tunicata]|jgi:flagellar biosynthesis protein|uniref:Flagellar biosynthesis protein FlhB n=1 Tax=Pseudoalteromonas tunicata D2 TaxID=87626 RepID=A4C6A6_9GAMM|nr:EscU/YscU/HrcU family type III secretion system export apparatus switch protein [Pseudoalteromonas tunicata]ATC95485.1 flagellar biosynthesis protein [Pseudoalteromonas tunicata]AXT31059.1 flagellar biosynthesis protein FlhB [Pseudoalteromonas tunicata]EAR29510.1 hypothetical protein PTD2_11859 [Pseudoalteromonas tunicata D2]MDP4982560.1 EscU/YscU/HrcU family type III secretion system export apparatus switch protein [Pseudoalteromonas tunicata]MDP5212414.1 EscU/YscU/HrcU family type III sec
MTQKAAIGLLYDGKNAPSVSVKGFGVLAEEILALAKEKNILIHQDEGLSDVIKQLELGQEIPRELYLIIAELIAFSYVLQGKYPPGWQQLSNKLNIQA